MHRTCPVFTISVMEANIPCITNLAMLRNIAETCPEQVMARLFVAFPNFERTRPSCRYFMNNDDDDDDDDDDNNNSNNNNNNNNNKWAWPYRRTCSIYTCCGYGRFSTF